MQQIEAPGVAAAERPWRPRPTATHPREALGALGPPPWSRALLLNVANPRLSRSLCLIDADGFSSAFVEEKCSVCCVALTGALSSPRTQPAASYTHTAPSFQIAGEDGCY